MVWVLVGISVIMVLVLSATSYFLLNRSLQHNAMAMAAYFQARLQNGKSDKAFTLGIFKVWFVALGFRSRHSN